MTTTHAAPAPTTGTRPARITRTPAVVALTVLAAVAVNLVIWGAGELAGGSFRMTNGDTTETVAPGGLVLMTALPLAVGLTVAALAARRWPGALRVAQVVGAALALVTTFGTFAEDFDTASTVSLAVAHVALAVVLVAGLEVLRRVHGAGSARH